MPRSRPRLCNFPPAAESARDSAENEVEDAPGRERRTGSRTFLRGAASRGGGKTRPVSTAVTEKLEVNSQLHIWIL